MVWKLHRSVFGELLSLVSVLKLSAKIVLTLLTGSALMTGCSEKNALYRVQRQETQDAAGAAHVAVIGVTSLKDVGASLEASFAMDEKTALAESLPTTLREQEQLLDAFRAALKIATPTTGFKDTRDSNASIGIPTSQSATTHTESASGDASKVALTEPFKVGEAATLPQVPQATATGRDPIILRQNALSLLQAVRLMNRSIKDAALRYDYEHYIVTLQITLMPYARNQPYDAYTSVSFFTGPSPSDTKPYSKKIDLPIQANNLSTFKEETKDTLSETGTSETDLSPVVTPLFVTDNLESASQSRASNKVRELALGLAAMIQGVSVSIDTESLRQRLDTLFGEDFNSLMTLGRVSENTVSIRLAAMNQATARYAMVPRTHNVYLLVSVPKPQPKIIRLVSRTTMRDWETGVPLRMRNEADVQKLIKEVIDRYDPTISNQGRYQVDTQTILHTILQNKYAEFKAEIDKSNGPLSKYADAVWLDLAAVFIGSAYGQAFFEVPAIKSVKMPGNNQRLILTDDGNFSSTVIKGGSHLSSENLTASLKTTGSKLDLRGDSKVITILSDNIEVSGAGSQVKLTFPSLRSLDKIIGDPQILEFTLTDTTNKSIAGVYHGDYLEKKKADEPNLVAVEVTIPAERVMARQDGTGNLQVLITKRESTDPKAKFYLSLTGADNILSAGDGILSLADTDYEIKKSGIVVFSLSNLNDKTLLRLSLQSVGSNPNAKRQNIGSPVIRQIEWLPRAPKQ